MTTHQSTAVTGGIMPDHAKAGVVFCRSSEHTTADDSLVSGDTLQLVPVPSGAKILQVVFYTDALPANTTGCDLGWGGDPNGFLATMTCTGQRMHFYPGSANTGDTQTYFGNSVGFLHTFTADDTIDLTIPTADTKIPTDVTFKLAVWYKMTGTISDET